MKKQHFLSLLTMALIILAPVSTYAIDSGGVGGKPAHPSPDNPRTQSIFIYELKPGQQANDGVLVSNNTNHQQTIAVYPVDSILSSGGAFACKQQVEPRTDVGAWINMQTQSLTLAPNSTQVVPFTVTVPQDAGVGEHDGCIAIQAQSQVANKNGSGVLLSFRSAIRVVVTVPGTIIKKLTITGVTVGAGKDNNYLVVPTVRNDGNVSLDTTSQIQLVSLFGTVVSTTKEGSSPVLPRSSESWQFKVPKPFWGGLYRARVSASYDNNPANQLGIHTTGAQLTRVSNSALFLAAPAPLAAVIEIIVLLLVIGLIVWLVRRRRISKHISKHWEQYNVKSGDTLQTLATSRGAPWQQIAKANKLKPPYHLEKDQVINLPQSPKE